MAEKVLRTYLIDRIIVEYLGSSQTQCDILVQNICAPEDSLANFSLYEITVASFLGMILAVKIKSINVPNSADKLMVHMINPRPTKQVECLR